MSYENRTLEHGKGISRKYTRTKQGIKRDRYRMKDPTQFNRPRHHREVIQSAINDIFIENEEIAREYESWIADIGGLDEGDYYDY